MNEYENVFEDQKKYFLTKVLHTTSKERKAKIRKIKQWIFDHQQDIRDAIYKDFKKPEAEVDLTEVLPLISEINHTCSNLKKWMRPKRVRPTLVLLGTRSKIIYEPKGVVLILTPWNFPFLLTIGALISAIAAGNCAMVKPSEVALHTAELISKMISELFDAKEVTVFLGDKEIAQDLLKLPFNHVYFTGSPEIGKKVMGAAAKHLSSVTLELGGLNPVIIDDSADLKDAAVKLIWGKFMNTGQSCMAPNYIMVHNRIQEQLIEELKKAFERMYEADDASMKKCPDFARMVNQRHFKRVSDLITATLDSGAELVMGGVTDEGENYISPTILNNVPEDSPVMKEEIFGPVMAIKAYDELDDVLSTINKKDKPLALYIFSRSKKNIDKIISSTMSGSVCVNDTTVPFIHPNLPFGGVNYSGIGKSHGYAGFLAFSNEKSVVRQRRGFTSFSLVYPPYSEKVKRMIRLITKYFL